MLSIGSSLPCWPSVAWVAGRLRLRRAGVGFGAASTAGSAMAAGSPEVSCALAIGCEDGVGRALALDGRIVVEGAGAAGVAVGSLAGSTGSWRATVVAGGSAEAVTAGIVGCCVGVGVRRDVFSGTTLSRGAGCETVAATTEAGLVELTAVCESLVGVEVCACGCAGPADGGAALEAGGAVASGGWLFATFAPVCACPVSVALGTSAG